MYQSAGLEICRFYDLNESKVFVYEQFKNCECKVPIQYLCKSLSEPYGYAYLEESPFYAPNGFERILEVKRIDVGLEFKEVVPVETDMDIWDEDFGGR